MELVKLKIIEYLLKTNIKIGQRLTFYYSKYSAEGEVGEIIKSQNFDLRGMKDRVKSVLIHDQDIINKRWTICEGCEFLRENNTCEKCGCFMKIKSRIATVACPIGKWDKEYDFMQGKPTNGTQLVVK